MGGGGVEGSHFLRVGLFEKKVKNECDEIASPERVSIRVKRSRKYRGNFSG